MDENVSRRGCSSRIISGKRQHVTLLNVGLFLGVSLATVIQTDATSYLIPLEQKVAICKVILRVSVIEAAPPKANDPRQTAVCNAKVLEVLKGPADLKEVEFRCRAYGSLSAEKLPQVVGKEYYVFLHEPPMPGRPPNERWLFEGPKGLRAVADEYTEERYSDGRIITDTYSRSNYVARIRALASQPNDKVLTGER